MDGRFLILAIRMIARRMRRAATAGRFLILAIRTIAKTTSIADHGFERRTVPRRFRSAGHHVGMTEEDQRGFALAVHGPKVVHLAVAQVLLTHSDLADRARANNARAALGALLDAGAILDRPQLEALYGTSVELITDRDTGRTAFLPG